jgi:hypothetical protein
VLDGNPERDDTMINYCGAVGGKRIGKEPEVFG